MKIISIKEIVTVLIVLSLSLGLFFILINHLDGQYQERSDFCQSEGYEGYIFESGGFSPDKDYCYSIEDGLFVEDEFIKIKGEFYILGI